MKKLVILFGILLLLPSVFAATYYVSTTGSNSNPGTEASPFLTIQKAVDTVQAGDTVYVRGGTYGNFRFYGKNGTSTQWITFKPYPGETVTVDAYSNNYANTAHVVYVQGSNYIEINGFNITDSNPKYDSDNFSDYSFGRIPVEHRGVVVESSSIYGYSTHVRIFNNEIYHTGSHGLVFYNANHIDLINNSIHHTGLSKLGYGIYVSRDTQDITIRGNVWYENYAIPIHAYNPPLPPQRILVENNIFYNNGRKDQRAGYEGYPPEGIDYFGDAVLIWYGSGHIIRNNLIYNNTNNGINLNANNGTEVYHNTIYNNGLVGNGNYGIYIYSNSGAIVKNNIIYQNEVGAIRSSPFTVSDNNLIGTDPLFIDEIGRDFHLQASSPAIDNGTTISNVTSDLDGISRPQGSAYDIGAYEYQSAPASQDLVALYQFDENSSTTVTDNSGNGNNGTVNGAIWTNGGISGGAYTFDGSNDYISLGSNTDLLRDVGQATVTFWSYTDLSSESDRFPIDITRGGGTSSRFEIAYLSSTDNGNLRVGGRAGDGESFQTKTTTSSPLKANTWQFITAIIGYANDDIQIYVDGVNQSTTGTPSFTATSTSDTSPQNIVFGIDGGLSAGPFDGLIDEIRIYNYALTPEEISALNQSYNTTPTSTEEETPVNTPPGGGGGGSGGGTSSKPSVTENQTTETITPLQSIIFTGFNPDLRIKQVEVRVNSEVQNAGLVVSKYDSRPELIPVEKPGLVYRYLEFQEINIGDSLDKAIITFFVDKDWVDGNQLKPTDVSFFRYNEGVTSWNELPTKYNTSDDDYYYYYYEAESEDFGFFAIGEENKSILETKFGTTAFFLLIGGILVLAIVVLLVIKFVFKKRNQAYDSGTYPLKQ